MFLSKDRINWSGLIFKKEREKERQEHRDKETQTERREKEKEPGTQTRAAVGVRHKLCLPVHGSC